MPPPSHDLVAGQLRRHIRLESEATYRICAWNEHLVEVEVISAPGLRAGRRFRFRRELVEQMEIVREASVAEPQKRARRAGSISEELP